MPTYRTGNPIGTASAKDLYDDAQDFDNLMLGSAASYPDRLGRVRRSYSGFETLIKQAIASAGYDYIGDYSEGILTITNYNQIFKYEGEFYKVKASVSLNYVTKGTSADTWETEFNNGNGAFVSVGDAALRQNLSSASGAGLIGGCTTLDEVRSIEPSYHGQKLKVITVISGGPVVNAYVKADLNDTTTADDDYSVFVTSGGARWKVKADKGIDVRFAGLKADLSNLGSACQKIIDGEVAKINANLSFKGTLSQINIPANLGEYTLDQGIAIPSMMQLSYEGNLFAKYNLSSGPAIWIKNTALNFSDGGLSSQRWFSDIQGSAVLGGKGGRLYLTGTQSNVSVSTNESLYADTAAVRVGELGTDKFSVRDLVVGNVTCRWFGKALQIDNSNNYCNQYEHFTVSGCDWGIYFTDADTANGKPYTNSGEHINFNKMIIGDTRLGHVYLSAYGYYYMNDCHLDYTKGDVFYFGTQGTGVHMVVNNPHIEGFDGYLVNSPTYTQYSSWHLDSTLVINNPTLMINKATNSGNSLPFRKLVNILAGVTRVTINDPVWALWTGNYNKHNLPYVALAGWDNLNPEMFTINTKSSLRPISWMYPGCIEMLTSYNAGLLGRNRWYFNNSSGIYGRSLTIGSQSSSDSNTLVYFDASDTSKFSVAYDTALDSDGHMSLVITSTDASATLSMILPEYVDGKELKQWQGGVSVAGSAVTSGSIKMYLQALAYSAETITATETNSVVTINRARTLRYSHTGNTIVVSNFISGAGLSTSDFVGVFSGLAQYYEGDVVQLRQVFTGFVGTIRIKCPVWWSNKLN